ncbi:MAG TPA: FtsK/SpoIIIE domain-containing protein [Glaciibacter sp.]|nr:FtsK/SpoIIIE domain-containing protein [Glaciibacter sp.]
MQSTERLPLPRRPTDPVPVQFPVIASLAPLAAAGLIWAISGSALALVFGGLGPVIAVATMLDGRRVNRKLAGRDRVAWLQAREALRSAVAERHDRSRRAAWLLTPAAATILSGEAEAGRWRPDQPALVTLGAGTIPGGVVVDGEMQDDADEALRTWAAFISSSPVTADIAAGLGLTGPPALARAVARSVLVQLAHARSPAHTSVAGLPVDGWEWARNLPHASSGAPGGAQITLIEGPGADVPPGADVTDLLVAICDRPDQLPPRCATIIRLTGPAHGEVIRSPTYPRGLIFRPDLVTEADAAEFAETLTAAAMLSGLAPPRRAVPETVALAALLARGAESTGGVGAPAVTLACPIGTGADGTVVIDLVGGGPHAIVGGTTGSGKSELLVTWVVSMASAYSPAEVTFLLVDFKGGAAFAPLRSVPHCVGVLTDLDERQAARALASLRAELRYREQVLLDAGARDIIDPAMAGVLPRLVIVVDEFQAMLDTVPALHGLFVSLAARGRSLGIHLVLCTQRPAGVVHDSLLANCSLRISLRVNNAADSRAVIGTDVAASISRSQPGRSLVQGADELQVFQCAKAAVTDIARLAEEWSDAPVPRRPWLDPLPPVITTDVLRRHEPGVPPDRLLGLLDEPEHQRHRVATYDAGDDGHLLVVGDSGSGKSSILRSLAARDTRAAWLVPADVEAVWDALAAAKAYADTSFTRIQDGRELDFPLILLDDLDAVFGRWEPEYQLAALETLTTLLRDGPASGIRLVISVQRLIGPLRPPLGLCANTVLLRLSDREDYRAAGGALALFDPDLQPGSGLWKGARIQIVAPGPAADNRVNAAAGAPDPAPHVEIGTRTVLVVSGAPAHTASRLRALCTAPGGAIRIIDIGGRTDPGASGVLIVGDISPGAVLIGTPDDWQRQWTLLTTLRPTATMIADRCSVAEFRQASGTRQLPPPLAPGRSHVWTLTPGADAGRATLPAAEETASAWPAPA